MAEPRACSISVSPQYFRAAGTSLLQGRPFREDDSAGTVSVAIVNQAFARQYFHGDSLGQQFREVSHIKGHDRFIARMTIVGVVQNVRYNGLTAKIEPTIYLPFAQQPEYQLNILLRTTVESGSLTSALRKAVIDTDPDQPLFDITTMEGRISRSVAQQRLMMLLTASFAVLALVLAGVGIYGVFSYWVSQRRQEMGIRLALGSSRSELLRLVVMQALRLILLGGVVGLAGAWFLDRLLRSMLVGVTAHDPVSFSLAWALMTLIALLGSSLPAVNATKTDLVSVLHAE